MERKRYDASAVKAKIDQKEANLIGEISDKVANEVSGIIEADLRDKIDSFVDSIDAASEKTNVIGDTLHNLTSTMETLQNYDFSTKLAQLQTVQQSVTQAVGHAETVFDSYRTGNEKFLKEVDSVLKEWQNLQKQFSGTIDQGTEANKRIASNTDELDIRIQSINSIIDTMTETLDQVKKQLSEIHNDNVENQICLLREENSRITKQLTELQTHVAENKPKVSIVSIGTLAVGIIVAVLEIVSFFI